MSKKIDLEDISLSLYSIPYSVGFIKNVDGLEEEEKLSIVDVALMAKKLGLGGIEFPIDICFPDLEEKQLDIFFEKMRILGIKCTIDFENFSCRNTKKILPILNKWSIKFIRVKISSFYGGNRHLNPKYYKDLVTFEDNLKVCIDDLNRYSIKILIENHQDVVVEDLLEIIKKYGKEIVGVNWDIGNSLPSCETPETFLKKTGEFIENIHLKDYKLYKHNDGYSLNRCALGDGFVDFDNIFKQLKSSKSLSMTIELGAHFPRVANINNSNYWEHSKISDKEKEGFLKYINKNISDECKVNSENKKYIITTDKELLEVEKSVNYLKRLLN